MSVSNASYGLSTERAADLDIAIRAALAGARAIAPIAAGPRTAETKGDGSPVSAADLAADRAIRTVLTSAPVSYPIVSEEVAASGWSGPIVWMVDPLDGTKEFIAGRPDYTVNVALIEDDRPVLGVVVQPEAGTLYAGVAGDGAFSATIDGDALVDVSPLSCRGEGDALVAVASRSHRDARTDAFLAANGIAETRSFGSSLKFCRVAAGEADVYPRLAPTMAWDTAAAHAVLLGAGGVVIVEGGAPLTYAADRLRNPYFVAVSSADLARRLDMSAIGS